EPMNIAVVEGHLLDTPVRRHITGDREVVTGTIRVAHESGTDSVPFSWFDAPSSVDRLPAGAPVVAGGRIQRRFFRLGGRTESRTDLVISVFHRRTERKRLVRNLTPVLEELKNLLSR